MFRLDFSNWLQGRAELLMLPMRVLAYHVSLVFGESISTSKTRKAIRSGVLVLRERKPATIPIQPSIEHYALFSRLWASLFYRELPTRTRATVQPCKEHASCFLVKRKGKQVEHVSRENVRVEHVPYIGDLPLSEYAFKTKMHMTVQGKRRTFSRHVNDESILKQGEVLGEFHRKALAESIKGKAVVFKNVYHYIEQEMPRFEYGRVYRYVCKLFTDMSTDIGMHLVGTPLMRGKRQWRTLITKNDVLQDVAMVLWSMVVRGDAILSNTEELIRYLCGTASNVFYSYFEQESIPVLNSAGDVKLDKGGKPITKKVRRFRTVYHYESLQEAERLLYREAIEQHTEE